MGVHQIRKIELSLSFDEVFNLCISSLDIVTRCKIKNLDKSNGIIEASAGISWKTWGDKISIKIHKKEENLMGIEISSKPALSTTIIDYGKNKANVEKILCHLKEGSEKN
ncbi:MAG: hypothetical protein COC01_03350 [Bacteroidetes bacterium]|nr:MAG: hypothetical protein COC01_03350 [Bacteroidota bacterium]